MESESGTNNTKISDSGYSNSCSNTNSQRSDSSKSRHSGGSNSSRSSGYGEGSKQNDSGDREHKKKPSGTVNVLPTNPIIAPPPMTVEAEEIITSDNAENEITKSATPLTTVASVVHDTETAFIELEEKEPSLKLGETNFDKETLEWAPMPSSQPEVNDGFCCVISMYDGVVLYTSPSLTSVLGFPTDMWLGHSFIDFVHPKDRETFANEVSTSAVLPLQDSQGKVKDVKNYLYVSLRRHAAVGISVVDSYQPFHLTVTVKQMAESPETVNGLFLVIIAVPVYSAYKVPRENRQWTKFGMRHTATCIFSYVDPDVVTNFGFLPQDILGKSVFDFYHPEDMPFMKEVYKSVMKTCQINGSVFRSKPYRFLVQNGCFAMIETEWSSVFNPWSKRLEFVISLHQVLQGPLNPNVFDVVREEKYKNIPEEVVREGKELQAEILQILAEEFVRPMEIIGRKDVSKRCRDVANFMESFMNTSKLAIDVCHPSISERDSVMLGEISPHHDFCDSKSSSETPPSYNQLNYNENINRFFQSNPKTSDERNVMDTDGKNILITQLQNSRAPSSGSNPNFGTNTSHDDYKPPHLTESVLVRHNEDMEKIMIQKHKKERSHIKDRETKKNHQKFERYDEANHGVKRCGSHSWDKECYKTTKHNRQNTAEPISEDYQKTMADSIIQNHPASACNNGANEWPSFSVTLAPSSSPGMGPVFYVQPPQRYQVQYTPVGLVCNYNPVFIPQPILCPTVPVFTVPVQNSSSPISPGDRYFGTQVNPGAPGPVVSFAQLGCSRPSPQCDRPSSQATSVKAEPGSRRGSIASASLVNKALSECSPKDLGLPLAGSPDTPLVSSPDGEIRAEQFKTNTKKNESIKRSQQPETDYRTKRMDEESSCYSSSYSSLLKTDTGSGSNDDASSNNNTHRIDDEMLKERRKTYPMRKKDPPWVESVSVSSDLIYRYQVEARDLEDILKTDMNSLRGTEQPMMVNDQLHQLYIEMEMEGLSKALTLEEEFMSSSSSSSSSNEKSPSNKVKKKNKSYGLLMMMYEDDAPLPSPEASS